MLVFLPGRPAKAEINYGNCNSKDVYDAGYILRLDMDELARANVPVGTEVYQYVVLWTPKKIFSGRLNVSRTFNGEECRLSLTDAALPPQIQLQFAVDAQNQLSGSIRRVGGADTRKFSEVVCDPPLQAMLIALCR